MSASALVPRSTDVVPRPSTPANVNREPVGVVPLRQLLPAFTVIGVPMGVLWAGRPVCLLAQRFPPAVWFVRAVYRWKRARSIVHRAGETGLPGDPAPAGQTGACCSRNDQQGSAEQEHRPYPEGVGYQPSEQQAHQPPGLP